MIFTLNETNRTQGKYGILFYAEKKKINQCILYAEKHIRTKVNHCILCSAEQKTANAEGGGIEGGEWGRSERGGVGGGTGMHYYHLIGLLLIYPNFENSHQQMPADNQSV